MRVLVTGSRTWSQPLVVHAALDALWNSMTELGHPKPHMTVVHGKCPTGADEHAAWWVGIAVESGQDVVEEPHPADWSKFGKSAGFRRNTEMVETGVDVCLSFSRGGSRGTRHCTSAAQRAGVPVVRYTEGV